MIHSGWQAVGWRVAANRLAALAAASTASTASMASSSASPSPEETALKVDGLNLRTPEGRPWPWRNCMKLYECGEFSETVLGDFGRFAHFPFTAVAFVLNTTLIIINSNYQ